MSYDEEFSEEDIRVRRTREELENMYRKLTSLLSRHKPNTKIPPSLFFELERKLSYVHHLLGMRGYYSEASVIEKHLSRLHRDISLVEAKELIDNINNFLLYSLPKAHLEKRIRIIEHELAQLRLQPALQKKVAKLEEDLRKLRMISAISYEENEKKQEDMLKKYKSAEKKVFVIMPFDPMFDDVWKGGIKRACNTEGFACLRVDKISLSTWITEDIEKCIEMADVVIADITGNNPNVMFELGWALAKGKKPIVIRKQDDSNKVPFDVQGIRYISYLNTWSGIEKLYADICKFLRSTSEILGEKPTEKKKDEKTSKEKTEKS